MKKLALLFVVALIAALPAHAVFWTFLSYDDGSSVLCTGEVNYSGGGASCDLTTTGGIRVTTTEQSGLCKASIYCDDGSVRTCYADETWGIKPAICFAVAEDFGDSKAECKSSLGAYAMRCN
jgi:hypothetical protein